MKQPAQPAGLTNRKLIWLDVMVAAWMALWAFVGIYVGVEFHHLARLATTLSATGQALHQLDGGLRVFTHLPGVGARLGKLSAQIGVVSRAALGDAASARSSVDRLSYLMAVAIVVIPDVPALAAYLPYRARRSRDASQAPGAPPR